MSVRGSSSLRGRPLLRESDPLPITAASPQLERVNAAQQSWGSSQGKPRFERVFVRVYDLGRTYLTKVPNAMVKAYGAFHTGVEVYGVEWSFGMTLDPWAPGIAQNLPGHHPDHSFRETLSMGCTHLSQRQVKEVLDEMKLAWRGGTYNVFTRNCHHFSEALCAKLGVAPLPAWVNSLAGAGYAAGEMVETVSSSAMTPFSLVGYVGSSVGSVLGGAYSLILGPTTETPEEEQSPAPRRTEPPAKPVEPRAAMSSFFASAE